MAAKYTAAQTAFTDAMTALDKKGLIQMKLFLASAIKQVDYISLISEKVSPHLEIERLFCCAMDDLNDQTSSALRVVPTGGTQEVGDFEEYDVDDDDDEDKGDNDSVDTDKN